MNLNERMRRLARAGVLVLPATLALAAVACNEKLDGTAGCPLTCVDQSAQVQTVDLDAVTTATSVLGGLGLGTTQRMLLASRGDTLDTRVIIRFDSLPASSAKSATDTSTATSFQYADSVYLRLRVDSAAAKLTVPATISVYDVDTSAVNDTSAAVLQTLFTPARLVASTQIAAGKLADSVAIRLPNAFLVNKAQAHARVRLGLQVTASQSVSVRVASAETPFGPSIMLRNYPDTTHKPITLAPHSATPSDNRSIATNLSDFTIVVKGTTPPSPALLAVGGLPGTRAYFRFNVPPRIVDSSLVVRATLLLTQVPSTSPDPTDTMSITPALVLAGPTITDPAKAAQITASASLIGLEPLKTVPGAAGIREVEIAPIFKYWAAQPATDLPRAIVLESSQEDYSPQQALFYSPSAADPSVRPKLRISYTLRSHIGLP